jgi:23S rRNA (guanosine2251-2'-O)-methyltransferase
VSEERAFGLHAVEALLRSSPGAVRQLSVARGRDDRRLQAVLKLADAAGVPVRRVARERLDALVDGRHQGIVAELGAGDTGAADLRWSEAQLFGALRDRADALLLILDGVTDPHNLGACLRSADAAGATALITPKDKAADITATVRKVASGATSTVPLVRVTNLARTMMALKDAGVWIFGTTGDAPETLYGCDFTGPTAIVMGAEGSGMRRLTREHCDIMVRLPMAGQVSSLNVSVAAGICLYEVVRQRRAVGER